MATARDAAPESARLWVVPVVRGILALIAAAVITFSQNHSPGFGLTVFGVWALASGLVVGALMLRAPAPRGIRSLFAVNAVATTVAGLLALTVPGGLPFLLYLVSVWAAVTGIVELFAGIRSPRPHRRRARLDGRRRLHRHARAWRSSCSRSTRSRRWASSAATS